MYTLYKPYNVNKLKAVKVNIFFVTFSVNFFDVYYTMHRKVVVVLVFFDVQNSFFMELFTRYWTKRAASSSISTCYAEWDVISLIVT